MAKITITTTVVELSVDEFMQLADRVGSGPDVDAELEAKLCDPERADQTPLAAVSRALTQAEYLIADMIICGLTTKQIMRDLTLAESTVKSHRGSIKRKLGTSSLSGLKKCKSEWWTGPASRPERTSTEGISAAEQGRLL